MMSSSAGCQTMGMPTLYNDPLVSRPPISKTPCLVQYQIQPCQKISKPQGSIADTKLRELRGNIKRFEKTVVTVISWNGENYLFASTQLVEGDARPESWVAFRKGQVFAAPKIVLGFGFELVHEATHPTYTPCQLP